MFASARRAFQFVFDPAFRGVLLKSVLLTLLLFAALFAGVEFAIAHLPTLGWHWVNVVAEWLAPVLFVLLLVVLGAPVAALVGTFFLDEIAQAVEAKYYPSAQGHAVPFFRGLWTGLRLTFWILLFSLLLLPFHIFLPVVGTAFALIVDGWFLGREYFELAGLRHLGVRATDESRRRHGGKIFAGGLLISLLAAIPVVNLISPLFASAFMAHEFQRYGQRERAA
jgi:CysZ protein